MQLKYFTKLTKKYLSVLIALFILVSLCGCSGVNPFKPVQEYSTTTTFFDTLITLTVYDTSKDHAQVALNECIDKCEYYEKLFNANIDSSDINKINTAGGCKTAVSSETIDLLKSAEYYSELSEDKFDVTIYSVSKLWDFHDIDNPLPDDKSINEAVTHVDHNKIKLDESTSSVTLTDPAASIDIGGIAKGYIADMLCEYLSGEGVTGAVINIGGDISTMGVKKGNKSFIIGIYNPLTETTGTGVKVKDMAVATSGTYERQIIHDGKSYHHILDPQTGYPADTDLVSASMITKKAIDADALCTIAILSGSDKTLSLVNSLPDTECILIKKDGTILYSDNARSLLSF